MKPDFSSLSPGNLTASLVVDSQGRSVSEQGDSKGIGNETDFAFLMWLRSRSQVILTSGKTAQAENYKLPSSSKLAIYSNTPRTYSRLQESLDKVMFVQAVDFLGAIESLQRNGYELIHTEFGETGFRSLSNAAVNCFVSSEVEQGIRNFAQRLDLNVVQISDFGKLFIALVTGRGRA